MTTGLPLKSAGFYQESGRAGRDGRPSVSVVYYGVEDKSFTEFLLSLEEEQRQGKRRECQEQGGSGAAQQDINKTRLASFEALVNMCQGRTSLRFPCTHACPLTVYAVASLSAECRTQAQEFHPCAFTLC
jgi:superfamily II DNA helicase RecQ